MQVCMYAFCICVSSFGYGNGCVCMYASRVFEYLLYRYTHMHMKTYHFQWKWSEYLRTCNRLTQTIKRDTISYTYNTIYFLGMAQWILSQKWENSKFLTNTLLNWLAFEHLFLLFLEIVCTFFFILSTMLIHQKYKFFLVECIYKSIVDKMKRSKDVRHTYIYVKIQSHWKCMANIYNGRRKYTSVHILEINAISSSPYKMTKDVLFCCDTI